MTGKLKDQCYITDTEQTLSLQLSRKTREWQDGFQGSGSLGVDHTVLFLHIFSGFRLHMLDPRNAETIPCLYLRV